MRKLKNEKPLIMIADHDEDERGLLRAMLKLKGFNVIEAADGQEAIDLAIDKRPDLLVVDLTLPRVSGSAAISRIRKRAGLRHLPIVAISLRHPLPIGSRSPNERSTVHLNKPIAYDELDALLDRFFPGRRLSFAGV
jgi:two-component system, OmpR family, KDP operon response regulator KdpE